VRTGYPVNPKRERRVRATIRPPEREKITPEQRKTGGKAGFVRPGRYRFAGVAKVTVSNEDADGSVFVDAVQSFAYS